MTPSRHHFPRRLAHGSSSRCGHRRHLPEAHSSLHASTFAQILSSVRSIVVPLSAHCHTTMRFQPASSHAFSLRWSRLTFLDHFSIQNAMFDFGMVESLHPCLCQKHPRTSIIVLALGITTSGFPGYRLSHTLNRQPKAKSRLRTRISGTVSLPRIFAINRLRCSGVIVSIYCFLCAIASSQPPHLRTAPLHNGDHPRSPSLPRRLASSSIRRSSSMSASSASLASSLRRMSSNASYLSAFRERHGPETRRQESFPAHSR